MVSKQGPIRVKSRSKPTIIKVVPPSQAYTAAGVPNGSPFGGGNLTVFESWEKIAYTTKRASQRHTSNVCDHQSYTRYYAEQNPTWMKIRQAAPHNTDGWYLMYANGHLAGTHALTETAAFSALGTSIDLPYPGSPQSDLDANLYDLRPDLTELSLPNFLLELDDIQKLWPQLKRNMALWRTLANKATFSNQSTAKILAGDHLAYSFGVKPLLGDIGVMREIIMRLLAKLKAFDDLAGEITTRKKTIKNLTTTKTGTVITGGGVQYPAYWYAVLSTNIQVGLTFKPLPREATGGYTLILKALLDALGFELNPRILWDAIPFTFVLDWFFDTGSWLERHKHDTLELPIAYVDSFVQCAQDLTISSYYVQNKDDLATDAGRRTHPAWITHKKRFMRFPAQPTESAFTGLGWSLPTLNQAKLLVSLGTVLR
jgi:hypothetical protein